jgi:hypothetical protein
MFTVLGIIAFGLMCDIVLNGGTGIATVIGTKKEEFISDDSWKVRYDSAGYLLKELVDEIDSFHDDLTYDNSPEEIVAIKAKIAIREKLIDRLLTE